MSNGSRELGELSESDVMGALGEMGALGGMGVTGAGRVKLIVVCSYWTACEHSSSIFTRLGPTYGVKATE